MTFNLEASEFVPSWYKKPAPAPAPATTVPTPPVQPAPAPPKSMSPEAAPWSPPSKHPQQQQQPQKQQQQQAVSSPPPLPPRGHSAGGTKGTAPSHTTPQRSPPLASASYAAAVIGASMRAAKLSPHILPQAWPGADSHTKPTSKSNSPSISVNGAPSASRSPLLWNRPLTPSGTPMLTHQQRKQQDEALRELTMEKIIDTAETSALNVTATVFVPAGMREKLGIRDGSVAGSSKATNSPAALPQLPPSVVSMPLQTPWVMHYNESSEHFDPFEVITIEDVKTFWGVVNNSPQPSAMAQGATYYFFRKDIPPLWEHEANRNGGTLTCRVYHHTRPGRSDNLWTGLLVRAIAENWEGLPSDAVTGLVIKCRERFDVVQVWLGRFVEGYSDYVASVAGLELGQVYYLGHQAAKELSDNTIQAKQASPLVTPSAKKKKKQIIKSPNTNSPFSPDYGRF